MADNAKVLHHISEKKDLLYDFERPMKPFASKSQTFGLGRTIWADKFWVIWGIFGQFISTYFTVSPLSMFFINQPLFLQKLSLYIQIPKIHLGLGFEFEFGPQKNWGFSHHVSVVRE